MSSKCSALVYDDALRRSFPCQKAAKYERDGRHYCGTHNPEAKARRMAKAQERYQRRIAQVVGNAAKRKEDEVNARRYLWLRDRLYQQTVCIGTEASVDFYVVGACPSIDEFDAAIDEQMAEDDRYAITDAGRAMLKGGE